MVGFVPSHLAISVCTVEEITDVAPNSVTKRSEFRIVSCPTEIRYVTLSEILIGIANLERHIDVFDVWRPTESIEHCNDHFAKATSLTGTNIVDPTTIRLLEKKADNRNDVVYVDKVAALVSISDTIPM